VAQLRGLRGCVRTGRSRDGDSPGPPGAGAGGQVELRFGSSGGGSAVADRGAQDGPVNDAV
jgi:hypothetical protein